MPVERFGVDHPLWTACLAHLNRHNMARWVLKNAQQPRPNVHFLGIVQTDQVIGHLTLQQQPILIPATEWSGGQEQPVTGPGGQPLPEMFVQTFAVDESHRRQGFGRALQLAALGLTRECGCYQLRSWSSANHPANYALKLSLGFGAAPATYQAANGLEVCGVYFVKVV